MNGSPIQQLLDAIDSLDVEAVMALLSQSGPAKFTFADGSTKEGIPIGLQLQMQGGGLQIKLLDPTTNQSQPILADEVGLGKTIEAAR